MNKKFRAINNYLTNYDYNSLYLQKLRGELKKRITQVLERFIHREPL